MATNTDLVLVGTGIVFACFLCTLRFRLVLWAEAVFSGAACVATFCYDNEGIRQLYSHRVELDGLHELLMCTWVALKLMSCVNWLLCYHSNDTTCLTAIGLSRFVSYTVSSVVVVMQHRSETVFSDHHLVYMLFPYCLWSVVMLLQLFITGSRVNIHIRAVDINSFLKLDRLLLMLCCLPYLLTTVSISQWVMDQRTDSLHMYLYRLNGCQHLSLAVIPSLAHRFRFSEDKHAVLLARVTGVLAWYSIAGWMMSLGKIQWCGMTFILAGQMTLLFLPALMALLCCERGPFTAGFWTSRRKRVVLVRHTSIDPTL